MQNVETMLLPVLYILRKLCDVNKAIFAFKTRKQKMKNPTHDTNTIIITSLSSTLLYPKTTSIITKQHCVQIMYLECNGIQIMFVWFFAYLHLEYSFKITVVRIVRLTFKNVQKKNAVFKSTISFVDLHYIQTLKINLKKVCSLLKKTIH
jgi:hypothetical protein